MIGEIIVGIVFILCAILVLMISVSTESNTTGFISPIIAGLGIGLIIDGHQQIPKAIDVYRGNTTLQITYEDGVPVDSVVVFKEK